MDKASYKKLISNSLEEFSHDIVLLNQFPLEIFLFPREYDCKRTMGGKIIGRFPHENWTETKRTVN